MIDAKLITTAQDLPGYRVTRNLGVVRGIIVRSRSLVGNIGASLQTLFRRQYHDLHRAMRDRRATMRTVR